MNSTVRKIIVAAVVGLFFGGSAAVGGAIQYPDLPAIAQVGFLLSGFGLGAILGFVADWAITHKDFDVWLVIGLTLFALSVFVSFVVSVLRGCAAG